MKKVMRNKKVIAMMVAGLVAILLATSGVVASPPIGAGDPPVESKINYQGQLTDDAGNPLDGNYDMQFLFYDAAVGGSQVGSTITENDVAVANGLFNVKLGVDQSDFNGQGLWLEVKVEGETLSPRQEILPVPYALSLKPGAVISDTYSYVELNRYSGFITTTKYGVYAESEGTGPVTSYCGVGGSGSSRGVYGYSDSGTGVYGYSNDGTGVYSYSASGAAISASGTGVIESTADSYIFISGNEFIKNEDTDTTRWDCMITGSVKIWRGASAGNKYIYIPITVPSVLYGQEVTVEELTIYYRCQDGTKNYITHTGLYRQATVISAYVIVNDDTDRTSNTSTSYTLTLTENNVLSASQGILCLQLLLHFEDDTNYIQIGGARLRLSHAS